MKRLLPLLLSSSLLAVALVATAPTARAADEDGLPPSRAIAPIAAIDTGVEGPRQVRLLNDGVLVTGFGGVTRHDLDGRLLWR
ncbi:MAG TPA: hypothetical protein VLA56_18240, partial [Pseudomonadales bacterium]|nr:hypothetical protein [Pseudomonadales bacterium]